jgi:CRISPR-associated protein Cas2
MYLLVPYDVSDDKRRREVEKILSSYGTRVNYSVFELELSAARMRRVVAELEAVSDPREDHIRVYVLDRESLKKSFVLHREEGIFDGHAYYL